MAKPKSATIVDQRLDGRAPTIAKDKERAGERFGRKLRAAQLHHAIDPFAEIGGLDGHEDPHLGGYLQHGFAS